MRYFFYDRKGREIDINEWGALKRNPGYSTIKQTVFPNGMWVSTVWLGMDLGWDQGPPLIFETMVFPSKGNFTEIDSKRYTTEEEAVEGHEEMCDLYGPDD